MSKLTELPVSQNKLFLQSFASTMDAMRKQACRVQLDAHYAYDQNKLLNEKIRFLATHCERVFDFGKSSRSYFELFKPGQAITVDINQYSDYPDIVDNLCDLQQLPPESADGIVCLSVLNHVYDPFRAAENLRTLLIPGGWLLLYTPFIFRYLAPENEQYEDYYRFSKSGLAYMFRDFSEITLYPVLGRYSTAINLFGFWKHKITRHLGTAPSRWLDWLGGRFSRASYDQHSVSGYYLWARK